MLKDLMENGFGKNQKLNCAEKILYGANEAYDLGLNQDALTLAAGFGGGMAVESTCGALTACIMVLSKLFVEDTAHNSKNIGNLCKEFPETYQNDMGSIDCGPLKRDHKSLLKGCDTIVIKAAEQLDNIITRELK